MSNKTQLQSNNAKLQDLLNTALGLPTEESVKNGKYVWKKCKETMAKVTNPTFKTTIYSSYTTFNVSSDSFDVHKVDESFFDGFELLSALYLEYSNGTLYIKQTISPEWSAVGKYDKTNARLSFSESVGNIGDGSYEGVKELPYEKDYEFLSHVISDNENAYPDKAVHSDGFYYEKVVGLDLLLKITGSNKIAVDKFVKASDTTINNQVKHSLGTIPKYAIINTAEWEKLTYSGSGGGIKYGFITCFGTNSDKRAMYGHNYEGKGGSRSNYSSYIAVNDAYVILDKSTYYDYYQSGIEYTIITMA